MTLREMIQGRQNEIAKGGLMPRRAAELLTELSALLGNVLDEIKNKELKYNEYLLTCLENKKFVNRAKIRASISREYDDLRTARNVYEITKEMIRSLKYFLRESEEVYRQSSN